MNTPPRAFGRGRRGRATALPNAGQQVATKYVPLKPSESQVVDSYKDVKEAIETTLRNASDDNLKRCLQEAEKYATDDENMEKVVAELFKKSLEDKNTAYNCGLVAAAMFSLESNGNNFRGKFFKKIQDTYKSREAMKKKAFDKYIAYTCLMTSIFKYVKIKHEPIKILVKPMYTMLCELVESKTENELEREQEVLAFRDNLLHVAMLLQSTDREEMDTLFKTVRCSIISETVPKISCVLLEMFELYCCGDWTANMEMNEFYNHLMKDIDVKS